VTFVTAQRFLDHFGLASARDLPGLKELRAAGLLEPAPPGLDSPDDEPGESTEEAMAELFADEEE
jgi:segregation and condensation protein B